MSKILLDTSKLSARDILKLTLWNERKIFSPRGSFPKCPICGEFILKDPDMHEALITRGMVSGHKHQDLIYSPYNCVLRHHICDEKRYHTPGIGSQEEYEKCLQHLVSWNGFQVAKWLADMRVFFPVVAEQAYQRYLSTAR